MQRRQKLFVLVVQVRAFPAKCFHDGLPLGERRRDGAVQRRVVRVRLLEVDNLGRQGLLHFLGVALSTRFEKSVALELVQKTIL